MTIVSVTIIIRVLPSLCSGEVSLRRAGVSGTSPATPQAVARAYRSPLAYFITLAAANSRPTVGAATVSAFGRGGVPRPQSLGGPPLPFSLHPTPYGRAPAGSQGLREIGVPLRGAFSTADAVLLIWRLGANAPASFGLGAFFALVVPSAVLVFRWSPVAADDTPVSSLAPQPSVRCVLAMLVRSAIFNSTAPAFICANSISSFKIYRAILYRTMDDFDYEIKLANARHYHQPPAVLCGASRPKPTHHPV